MTMRMLTVAAVCGAALVAVLPAAAKTPPPTVVAKVGIEVAKLGLATNDIDTANAKCSSKACLSKSYTAYYAEAHVLDGALEALWTAAGKSGACASAAVSAAAGFDAVTADYHTLQGAAVAHDKAGATKAMAGIRAKVPRLTAVINSFKVKCR